MSDFVRWLLLALTARSLVPVASTVMRRSLSCVEQLQIMGVICPAFCETILSTASSVCHAVHDIDAKISKSAKEAIEEATEIWRSSIKLLKQKLPIYLLGRKRRSLEKPKRQVQGALFNFHRLAKRAASAAVQAVKDGSKKIRDTMFNTIIALYLKHDNVSEAARYILGKVISKRSTNESLVIDALCKVSVEMKASMTKAVFIAISGFKDMLDNMVVKMKTLLQSKVYVGFFDTSKAQIAGLADQAGKNLVDVHHRLAMKSVNDAIMKVNDLMIAVCIVEKSIKNYDALFKSLRNVVEAASKGVKDAIHSEEVNPEEDVALAMKNAANQMVSDYNELVWIVMIYGAKPGK